MAESEIADPETPPKRKPGRPRKPTPERPETKAPQAAAWTEEKRERARVLARKQAADRRMAKMIQEDGIESLRHGQEAFVEQLELDAKNLKFEEGVGMVHTSPMLAGRKEATKVPIVASGKSPASTLGVTARYRKHLIGDDLIINRLADGETLTEILKSDGMPNRTTIYAWVDANLYDFGDRYRAALKIRADAWGDQVIANAKDKKTDPRDKKIFFDTHRWMMGKTDPSNWGEKVVLAGDRNNPITVNLKADFAGLTDDELAALESFAEARAQALEARKLSTRGTLGNAGISDATYEEVEDDESSGNGGR